MNDYSYFDLNQGSYIHTSRKFPEPHVGGYWDGVKQDHLDWKGQTTIPMFDKGNPLSSVSNVMDLSTRYPNTFNNSGFQSHSGINFGSGSNSGSGYSSGW